ncbi:histamine H2 receptor-like [Orbicella faveolata]|uniref:histamine H2 receptor-like n=1 Tax=Orbicella faveolata TaxID=48498 RepID=UPI0009E51ECD|nr:histamine H2 receptor-like [Orbicella faveolata]
MAGTDIYVVVFLSTLSVLIVLSNFCVCLLVYLKKALRTSTNWLMVSLAVSDILTGGILLPVFLIKPTSVVTSYIICIILLSGVANLCAVTYERYVAVIKPLEYPFRAPKILKRALILSWLLPTIYSLLPLFWDTNPALKIHKAYMVCLEFFGVVVPYIFITFAYMRIFKQVRRSLTMKKDLKPFRVHRNERKRISSDAKVAKVFSIVASTFLLCWLPIMYITTAKIINRIDVIPGALPVVSLFTVATGSLVNPLMYAFLKPDFKMAIRNCFTKGALTDTALTMGNTEGQERSRRRTGLGNSPKERWRK